MPDKILVLNAGSSSLKFSLFECRPDAELIPTAEGRVERVGEPDAPVENHQAALRQAVDALTLQGHWQAGELKAIGHRVVHGGESFAAAVQVTDAVVESIRAAIPLAPLHNPANLQGIEACQALWPEVAQVAVFDTAFHQTLPASAFRYAIPEAAYRDHGVRRYGFHGTSFASVTRRVAAYLACPRQRLNLLVLHLGNGASACAIRGGQSIDTSMGMTPLAGLMMGSRCGDLDPGVLLFWLQEQGEPADQVSDWLNRGSGLKGIAGTNDMRDILARAAKSTDARLAIEMYIHRLRHYIGAYRAQLPELHALVFTGGIGEYAAPIRAAACAGLGHLGLELDEQRNLMPGSGVREIQRMTAGVKILIVPADEEVEIARQTLEVLAPSTA